ncbi:hypothetical protein HX902_21735 [Rhizobium sp. WYCCWR 11317]|uniref:Uncharacterized protein n=1 Tax=Rhizobium changzhiense TaxID=2692317 RepID=A0ABR6ACA5_9HYPH|nr:hypothetical protein [Rhizobium changzhiense]
MNAAILCDVYEADEVVIVVGTDMSDADMERMAEKSHGAGVLRVADQRVLSLAAEGGKVDAKFWHSHWDCNLNSIDHANKR